MSLRSGLVRRLASLFVACVLTLATQRANAQVEQLADHGNTAASAEQRLVEPMFQTSAGGRYARQGVGWLLMTAAVGLTALGAMVYVGHNCGETESPLGCLGQALSMGMLTSLLAVPLSALAVYAIGGANGGTGRYGYTLLGSLLGFAAGIAIVVGGNAIDEHSIALRVTSLTLAVITAAACPIVAYEWSGDSPRATAVRLHVAASPAADLRGVTAHLTAAF